MGCPGRASGEGEEGCGACRAGREQLRGGETSAGVFLMEQVIQFRRLWHCLGVKLPGGEGGKKTSEKIQGRTLLKWG